MEKMLVCDYDDTVMTFDPIITYFNFSALKQFRDSGNKLVFATGRNFNSISEALALEDIEYDGLVCDDGCTVFLGSNLWYAWTIKDSLVSEIINYVKYGELFGSYALYNAFGSTYDVSNITEIVMQFKYGRHMDISELWDFFPELAISKHGNYVLLRKNVNKSDGINKINEVFGISSSNIYTIGNGANDYEMIRDFNGYNVPYSHKCLYGVSKGETDVRGLVKKII